MTPEPACHRAREDDTTVDNDAVLYRRLPPSHIVDDENNPGCKRLSSAAYYDPDPTGVSVYRKDVMTGLGLTTTDVVSGQAGGGWGVAETTAGEARAEAFGFVPELDTDATGHVCDPAHGTLTGLLRGNAGKRQAKRLAVTSRIV